MWFTARVLLLLTVIADFAASVKDSKYTMAYYYLLFMSYRIWRGV